MPFNENGQFIRVHNWTEDKSNNIPITASRMDAEDNGFADGLSQTLLRNGSVALTGNLKAGNHKLTGLKNGTADTDAATVGQLNTVQGNAVLLTGDQTVAGVKTFTSSPVVPTISADDNSTKVATTAWVNTTGNNVVHLTDDETITGRKTFTDRVYTNAEVVYINNVTKGTAPSSVQYGNIYMVDSTKSWGDFYALGQFVTFVNPDNTVHSQLQAFKNEAGSNASGYLRMTYDTANNQYFASIGGSASGTNYSLTRKTNSTAIQTIPTMGWVNNPATSTNVVHRSGDETIGGSKTFTRSPYVSNNEPRIFLNSTDVTRGTAPSAKEVTSINFQDTNGDWYGFVQSTYDTDKSVGVFIGAKKSISSSDTTSVYMGIGYDSSGNSYTSAPTPSDTTTASGTQIATTGWVNSIGNSIVHLSGSETITGNKTFTSNVKVSKTNPYVDLYNTNITKGTAPSSLQVGRSAMLDKDGKYIAMTQYQYLTDGRTEAILRAYNPNSETSYTQIGIAYKADGTVFTNCPIPTDTSSTSSQQIATVGWVNNPSIATNIVHRTGDETVGGVKTFSSQAIFEKANGIQLKGTNHYYTLRSIGNTPEGCALLLDNSSSSIAFNATDNRITIGSTAIPAYAIAPTDSYSTTSGTQIATTGWVGSNFVNVAGTQTISGGKTFTSNLYINNGDPRVFLKHSSAIKGTAPSSTLVSSYQVRDKNNELLGSVHTQYYSDKSILTQIVAYKVNNSSDTASSRISVGYDTNGNVVTAAPACDVNNSIITTINKSKTDDGYYELGNGLIIQWGSKLINGNTSATVTLPKAFTSTNYKIAVSRNTDANATGDLKAAYVRGSKTITGFELHSGSGNQLTLWIAIGY